MRGGKGVRCGPAGCVRLAGWPACRTLMTQPATELKDEWWLCVSQFPMQSLPSDDCVDDASTCADGRSQPFLSANRIVAPVPNMMTGST